MILVVNGDMFNTSVWLLYFITDRFLPNKEKWDFILFCISNGNLNAYFLCSSTMVLVIGFFYQILNNIESNWGSYIKNIES
jgi:hypothetical protein